jgi:CRP-like cAMP-binding protein
MNNICEAPRPPPSGGPSFKVPALWSIDRDPGARLSDEDRAMLAVISAVVRLRKGEMIYRQGDAAGAVFNVIDGVVKVFKTAPGGGQHVVAFSFSGDLIGLAADGEYVNSAQAVTPLSLYRLPAQAVESRLRRHAGLDFQLICRLCLDLREAQHHAYVLSKRHATARFGLFLQMLETHQAELNGARGEIGLPMRRLDIAAYLGISAEAVTRSLRELTERGVIAMAGKRRVRILQRETLEAVISDT